MAEFSTSEQTRALITAAAFDDFESEGAIVEEVLATTGAEVLLELALIAARSLRKVVELAGADFDQTIAAFMSARAAVVVA